MIDFTRFGLALFFAPAAAAVWVPGSRLTRYADVIRDATRLGREGQGA